MQQQQELAQAQAALVAESNWKLDQAINAQNTSYGNKEKLIGQQMHS